jgi:hypothetical protein
MGESDSGSGLNFALALRWRRQFCISVSGFRSGIKTCAASCVVASGDPLLVDSVCALCYS